MDIYDSRYFIINKKFLISFGLWPHQNYKQKLFLRGLIIITLFLIILPQLERLYLNIVKNFQIIKDKDESKVLTDYSEKGRTLTIFYTAYIIFAMILFVSIPTAPLILNNIKSLNISLKRMFLLGGDFFVDRDRYYTEILIYDGICILLCTPLMCAFDTMYFVCVQHCLGLFAIINFTEVLEATYSSTFLILLGLNVLVISFASILVLIKLDDIMNALRFVFIFLGGILHLFFISWPGQALIDYSTGLSKDAYDNEWYEISVESQRSLKFVTLRCIRPCQLTAGGMYVMNFANFMMIMKTSMSYLTMFTSLR